MASMAASNGDADQHLSLSTTVLTSGHHQGVRALGQAGATNELPGRCNIPQALAILAGSTFALASAATNLSYAVSRADGLPSQVTWGAVAVAASVALAIAPAVVVQSLAQRKLGMASIAMSAVVLFGSYSVSAALGAATGGRLTSELEASDVASKRQAAAASIAGAEKELAALPPSRLAIEVKAEIAKAMSSRRDLNECVGWLPHVNARAVCIAVADLKSELGRAEKKAELELRHVQARTTLDGSGGR